MISNYSLYEASFSALALFLSHLLLKPLTQLETEVRALRKQAQAQRQRIAQKCGHEFLALIDSDRNCKVVVTENLESF